ncbi:hypothetical protein [Nonomuraea sp. NPDC049725]|uniref:hypothetical protein n=1 Tax=Nonomuraea sp. NPDC049725 TaxID=3154508 RepID=UPI00343DCB3C
MRTWSVAERHSVPKDRQGGAGEDRLVVLHDRHGALRCVAVVDGATDKSGRDYGGLSGGARAAEQVAGTLARLPADAGPEWAVREITADLARLRARWGIANDDLVAPCAVAAVMLPQQEVVWRVGDVHVALARSAEEDAPRPDGGAELGPASCWERHDGDKLLDRVLAQARAAFLHCLLAGDGDVSTLAAEDPGRALILPLLRRQSILANRAGPYGYGVLDGRRVPERFIDIFPLDGVDQVVLASDGYLSAEPSLASAERRLAASVATDPLRIDEHPATKAVRPGADSFDDRTYVRLIRHPG